MAGLIALGIGLHNLGEGLAIGTSYASGEIALGTFLVVGFLLHNTTEGLGIVTPLAEETPRLRSLIFLGALAGVPTILGAWLGGFTYSPSLDHTVPGYRRWGHRSRGVRAVAVVFSALLLRGCTRLSTPRDSSSVF